MKSRTRRRRVGAVVLSLLAIGAVVFTLRVPPLDTIVPAESSGEVATIENFDVGMVLSKDGTLLLDETITVNFPIARRGIFRIFDTADPRRDEVDHPVDGLEVTRDGVSEPWVWVDSATGTATARIGQETVYLNPGSYTYRLVSSTRDVLEPSKDPDTTWWWWDVVGSGWQMPIAGGQVRVTLPAAPTSVECVIGESTKCEPVVDGNSLRLELPALSPKEPVTLRVGMPSAEVPPNQPASRDLVPAAAAGALGALLGLGGIVATRERKPGFPVLYEPPPGVRPAVGVRVLDEKPGSSELQATLFDLGERGVVRIDGRGGSWTVELIADPVAAGCDQWEVDMLGALGLTMVGSSFVVAKSISAGKRIESANSEIASGARAAAGPYLTRSVIGGLVRFVAWVSFLALLVFGGLRFFAGWEVPLPVLIGLGAFVVFSSVVATDVGTSTTRSTEGRDLWSRVGGFARFLSTDSSDTRFDAAAHMDWYPKYLPWALALGVGDEWTRRYEAQGLAEPAVPYVVGWGYGSSYGDRRGFADFNSSFNSAISSASAAYAASQSSSSGGGGGFSGGSGGGGGGGGSW